MTRLMERNWTRARRCGSVLSASAMLVVGLVLATSAAPAGAVTAAGSIVFVKADNIWISRPDGSGQRQITADGTPDDPYLVPSETEAGFIFAFRNRQLDDGQGHGYKQGFVYEMDRHGQLLRPPFAPPQYALLVTYRCPIPVEQEPQGLYDLEVSPDGAHIAYTPVAVIEQLSCSGVFTAYESRVANADGGGAVVIAKASDGTTTGFRSPTWVSASRVAVYNDAFLEQGEFLYDVGGPGAAPWFGQTPYDVNDNAYQQPAVKDSKVATLGQVLDAGSPTPGMVLWSTDGPLGDATARCQLTGMDDFNSPSFAPDASAVVYERTGAAPAGVWVASVADIAADDCSGSDSLLIAGGSMPFWGSASYDADPQRPTPAFTSVVPARLLDTRPGSDTVDGQSAGVGRLAAGTVLEVPVTGRAGVAPDAAAVALNVTVTDPAAAGFVTVYPCGERPLASNVNYVAGQTVPNAVIAPVSPAGTVCLFTQAATDLIADVSGWFAAGQGFTGVTPARLFDTRDGTGGVPAARLGDGQVLEVPVAGRFGVPASGAGAVALNVTVTDPAAAGFVTVYPCGERPLASNVNYVAGQTVPNAVIAPVSPAGTVCLFTQAATDLIADVSGWFAAGQGFTGVTPARLFDTRDGTGGVPAARLGDGQVLEVPVAGRFGVPASGAGAVALNVTVTDPAAAGFVTVYPCGERPLASNVNYVAGQTVPNAVIAPVSPAGTVCLFTQAATDLIADVSGWFSSQ